MAGTLRSDALAGERSRPFRWLVRAGFVARGLTYGLIGALSLALALGAGSAGAAPSQQGALSLISRNVISRIALVAIAAGVLAYALWKLTQAIAGAGPEGGGGVGFKDRVANGFGGIAYIGFFLIALRVLATGSGGSSNHQTRQAAAGVLGWPGGPVLVGAGGAILIGVSAYQIYEAVTGAFARENRTASMQSDRRHAFMLLGRVGISARAIVFALVGYFLVRAAIAFNARTAVGLDGALARVHHEPFGPWLLGLVAVGLLAFAAFSFAEARYRRL
jgi:hypothetical protein